MNKKLIISVVFLIAFSLAGFFVLTKKPKENTAPITTTEWKTFSDEAMGITFQYPENFFTTYIDATDWPPVANIIDGPLACVDSGEETVQAGKTESKTINQHEYCITKVVEGAAGSTYTQYAYAREIQNKYIFLTFTLRAPQCVNYDDPKKSACIGEEATFDINSIIDGIFETIKLNPITYINATNNEIIVDLPFPGAVVGKDFTVVGKARGSWFFEASFPIDVLDKDGKILFQTYATAKGEWMTQDFVPFKSQLIQLPDYYIGPATLVLHKDNPSDLPGNDASASFPITVEY